MQRLVGLGLVGCREDEGFEVGGSGLEDGLPSGGVRSDAGEGVTVVEGGEGGLRGVRGGIVPGAGCEGGGPEGGFVQCGCGRHA